MFINFTPCNISEEPRPDLHRAEAWNIAIVITEYLSFISLNFLRLRSYIATNHISSNCISTNYNNIKYVHCDLLKVHLREMYPPLWTSIYLQNSWHFFMHFRIRIGSNTYTPDRLRRRWVIQATVCEFRQVADWKHKTYTLVKRVYVPQHPPVETHKSQHAPPEMSHLMWTFQAIIFLCSL